MQGLWPNALVWLVNGGGRLLLATRANHRRICHEVFFDGTLQMHKQKNNTAETRRRARHRPQSCRHSAHRQGGRLASRHHQVRRRRAREFIIAHGNDGLGMRQTCQPRIAHRGCDIEPRKRPHKRKKTSVSLKERGLQASLRGETLTNSDQSHGLGNELSLLPLPLSSLSPPLTPPPPPSLLLSPKATFRPIVVEMYLTNSSLNQKT